MNGRVLIAACVALTVDVATPVWAHPGGHQVEVGISLHSWTAPRTGEVVPGSLMFVSGETVHVEDAVGRSHVWRIRELTLRDRELARDFRARVERLNGVGPDPESPQGLASHPRVPWGIAWLATLFASLFALLLCRERFPQRALVGVPAVAFAMALPLACGGGSTSGPVAPVSTTPTNPTSPTAPSGPSVTLPLASYFAPFSSRVRTRQDTQNLYVESDGLADHTLMVGIRSWQQQVPLPQAYAGGNAFTIPLAPRLADRPVSARTALFNGAIALAVNGVPIFNALNNRGDDAYLFGELDDFGGHAGRADDYHYHVAPFMLEATVGPSAPLAVALDGFPLYGRSEPDGSAVRPLDEYNGHADAATVYHYHGTRTYPYINGGMRGVVRVVDDHIDPQPSLRPVRPAGTPLNGATVTGFASTGTNAWRLEYRLGGGTYRVDYRIDGTRYTFVFTDPSGATRTEVYTR